MSDDRVATQRARRSCALYANEEAVSGERAS